MKKIIVTGGSGYIGSHASKELALSGYQPVIIDKVDNDQTNLLQTKYNALFEKVDITDETQLYRVLEKHADVCGVIHFAGLISVAESCDDPCLYYKNNVVGSYNVLHAVECLSIRNVVFSSSAAVYGRADNKLISEEVKTKPVNPYGHSKKMFEVMLESASDVDKIRYVSLRYFNACGADHDGEFGECHEPETHLIPLAIEAAETNTLFSVYGDDYDTPDGTAIRDYIHVKDLAVSHVKAIEHLLGGGDSLVLNLGTGRGYSVSEIITEIERISGKSIQVVFKDRRKGDPPILVADNKKAQKNIDFTPLYSDIDSIISSAIKWYHRSK